jgi:tetratricopeptide (TPR) repeat protein
MIRAWAIVIACTCIGIAHADDRSQRADQLFAEGRTLLVKQNDPKAACEKFEQAIKLEARATGTMLNLGLCYEMLVKHATSIRWFRKAQSAAFEAGQSDVEAAAKQHIAVLSPKLVAIKLMLDPAPRGVQIWIDGTQIDPTPSDVS